MVLVFQKLNCNVIMLRGYRDDIKETDVAEEPFITQAVEIQFINLSELNILKNSSLCLIHGEQDICIKSI